MAGTTLDNLLMFDLFAKTIRSVQILGKDMVRFRFGISDILPLTEIKIISFTLYPVHATVGKKTQSNTWKLSA